MQSNRIGLFSSAFSMPENTLENILNYSLENRLIELLPSSTQQYLTQAIQSKQYNEQSAPWLTSLDGLIGILNSHHEFEKSEVLSHYLINQLSQAESLTNFNTYFERSLEYFQIYISLLIQLSYYEMIKNNDFEQSDHWLTQAKTVLNHFENIAEEKDLKWLTTFSWQINSTESFFNIQLDQYDLALELLIQCHGTLITDINFELPISIRDRVYILLHLAICATHERQYNIVETALADFVPFEKIEEAKPYLNKIAASRLHHEGLSQFVKEDFEKALDAFQKSNESFSQQKKHSSIETQQIWINHLLGAHSQLKLDPNNDIAVKTLQTVQPVFEDEDLQNTVKQVLGPELITKLDLLNSTPLSQPSNLRMTKS